MNVIGKLLSSQLFACKFVPMVGMNSHHQFTFYILIYIYSYNLLFHILFTIKVTVILMRLKLPLLSITEEVHTIHKEYEIVVALNLTNICHDYHWKNVLGFHFLFSHVISGRQLCKAA